MVGKEVSMPPIISSFITGIDRPSAVRHIPGTDDILVGTQSGSLLRFAISGGAPNEFARLEVGSGQMRDIAVRENASTVVVVGSELGVTEVSLSDPFTATRLLRENIELTAVAVAGSDIFAVEWIPQGRLVRLDGSPLSMAVVVEGLYATTAIAVDVDRDHAFIASATGSVIRVDLTTGALQPIADGFGLSVDLAFADSARRFLLVADSAKHRIVRLDLDHLDKAPQVLVDELDNLWGVDVLDEHRLIIGRGDEVLLAEIELVPQVELLLPPEPLYLSSWARIPVEIRAGGPSFDDLLFAVEPVTTGCSVSYSRDLTFDQANPHIVLIAGGVVGTHTLRALDRTTGGEVGAATFAVTDIWSGSDGPPRCVFGRVGADEPEGTWGGGDPGRPQNVDVRPQSGTRQVAVVIVETNDATVLSTADQAALRARLRREVFTGAGSARQYFREASHNRFDIADAGVIGPIRLPNDWADYHPPFKDILDNSFSGIDEFSHPAIAEIRGQNEQLARLGQPALLDLQVPDSIILVIRTLPPPPPLPPPFLTLPAAHQWPQASRPGGGWETDFQIATETVITILGIPVGIPITRRIQVIAMPDDWTTWGGGRTFEDTVAHELGHNLGLPDEYADPTHTTDAQARDIDNWTLMSNDSDLPHLSTPEKLMLGWTRPQWVQPLSFALLGPVDETVTLHAAELGAPPAGQFAAVEVRIGDGKNYYFEYRSEQTGDVGDQNLPIDRTVVGTEFLSGSKELTDRRFLLRIRDDGDADRGEFQAGDDYEEIDTTSPKYPNDFIFEVLSTADDSAQIRIRYADGKPDPQIRTMTAETDWKSPDTEVRNARSRADSQYRNIPWEGHVNTMHATVRNPGKLDAPGVQVNFAVKDLTFSGGREYSKGSDVHDVDSQAEVEFQAPEVWIPFPIEFTTRYGFPQHYCTFARIAEYADPGDPAIVEVTPDNNEAQSNYTKLISTFASAASREGTPILLSNDRPYRARTHTIVRQTSPLARTYVEHAWVDLDSDEERQMIFYTEWVIGDETMQPFVDRFGEGFAFENPNLLRLTGVATPPSTTCAGITLGGAGATVHVARRTEFVRFEIGPRGGFAVGRIVYSGTNQGVDGTVLVSIIPVGAPEEETAWQAAVLNGEFRVQLGPERLPADFQGHYLGALGTGIAPCDSVKIRVEH
jgi:hypothetical protein